MQYNIADMNKIINMMNECPVESNNQMQKAENYKIVKILVLNLH